jgi:hypothetical protein
MRHAALLLIISFYFQVSIMAQQSWSITGNTGIKPGTNFVGTKDQQDLVFKTNGLEAGRILTANNSWRFGSNGNFANISSNGEFSFNGDGVYKVGGNRYVFQTAGAAKYGLFFNSATPRFEFRNNSNIPVFGINAVNGDGYIGGKLGIGTVTPGYNLDVSGNLKVGIIGPDYATFDNTGNLRFAGKASFKVGKNVYAIQDGGVTPGEGLYINGISNQWEFRDVNATPFFMLNTQNQALTATGKFSFGGGAQFGDGSVYSAFDNKGNLRFFGSASHLIGPNQFGLLCDGEPAEGLYMNGDLMQWEYKGKNGFPFLTLNNESYEVTSRGGLHVGNIGPDYSTIDTKGNLRFFGNAAHLVNENQFALLCNGMPQEGLYVNGDKMQWEFTDMKGVPYFTINSSSHDIATIGGVQVGNSTNAVAGNIRWDGDGFQGFDGKSWRTFIMSDVIQSPTTVRSTEQNQPLNTANDLQNQVNDLQKQVDDLKAIISDLRSNKTNVKGLDITLPSKVLLEQNVPNPFSSVTAIAYTLPAHYSSAQIVISDGNGTTIRKINLSGTGKGKINIRTSEPGSGGYQYSLIIDGRIIETKKMIQVK